MLLFKSFFSSRLFLLSLSDCHTTYIYRFVAGYEDGNPKSPLICLGSGSDGVGVLTDILTNDIVAYALCRVVSTMAMATFTCNSCFDFLYDLKWSFQRHDY